MYRGLMAVVLVAVAVTLASSTRTPTYEASAQVGLDLKQDDQQNNLAGNLAGGPRIRIDIPEDTVWLQEFTLMMALAIDSRPVAEEVIGRLGLRMEPAELLDKLTVEQVGNTSFIVLTYEGTDPHKAAQIVNTVGQVSSELIPERGAAGSQVTARVYEEAVVPESRASPAPVRNGLLTLVIGLALVAIVAIATRRTT